MVKFNRRRIDEVQLICKVSTGLLCAALGACAFIVTLVVQS